MADDHAPSRADAFNLDTDEGLDAYICDLETRHPIPERLRYPETPKAYAAAIEEARGGPTYSAEEVRRWIRSLGTTDPLPRPGS